MVKKLTILNRDGSETQVTPMKAWDPRTSDELVPVLREELDKARVALAEREAELAAFREREKALREALEYYADEDNWISYRKLDGDKQWYTGITTNSKEDNGARARRALDGEKE